MSKSVKPIYKIGDIVKIVKPEFFLRVGYPLCLDDVRGELDKYEDHITNLMHKSDMPWYDSGVDYKVRDGIKRALSYGILAKKNFGGRERKIFTALSPALNGKTMKVVDKKIVRSGFREKYQDTDGGIRVYLDKVRSHVILRLKLLERSFGDYKYNRSFSCQIEDVNVEKLMSNEK